MNTILDFHTHRTDAANAIISMDPRQFDPQPGRWYSVGYHPWYDVDKLTEADFDLLEQCAHHPQVLAVGETGMDSLRGADLETQAQAFVRHLHVATKVNKPVVVHCVRAAQRIIQERHKAGLDNMKIAIHGMRANERVAQILLDAGCYLSFGPRFNPAALLATPLDRLLIETDDSPATILDVAVTVAQPLNLPPEEIISLTTSNLHHFLTNPNSMLAARPD